MRKTLKDINKIYTDREKQYGSPCESFVEIAKLWSVVMGIEVTPKQVALCMIQLKVYREVNSHKRDNILDVMVYCIALEELTA